ncbi:MAG: hypothetical protein ABI175_13840 [Polyangiales bacterium]
MSKVRAKGQLLPVIGVVLLVLFTLGNAAANMLAVKRPTKAEIWAEERAEIVDARRARLVQLRAHVDHCEAANAHDLARLLVMDGRFDEVKFFAQGYQHQCGDDPVVEHWGQAPRPRAR